MALDLDRGVIMRPHPSGIKIAMYRDAPGEYLSERGDKIDPELAKQAGFDTDRDNRDRVKKQRLAAYKEQLEQDLATEEENLARALSSDKYDVRHVGGGQYAVFDADGEKVTKVALSKKEVELIIGKKIGDPTDDSTRVEIIE